MAHMFQRTLLMGGGGGGGGGGGNYIDVCIDVSGGLEKFWDIFDCPCFVKHIDDLYLQFKRYGLS